MHRHRNHCEGTPNTLAVHLNILGVATHIRCFVVSHSCRVTGVRNALFRWVVLTVKNFAGTRGNFFAELAKIKEQFAEHMPERAAMRSMVQMHTMANGVDERTLVVQLG